MSSTAKPTGVHLVGSIPFDDNAEVFRVVASNLASHLRRVPDGETGERSNWVGWQVPKLLANPNLELADGELGYTGRNLIRLKEGADARDLNMDSLGYAAEALDSFEVFCAAKDRGEVPQGCRFQVCLPTPLAPTRLFVDPHLQPAFEKRYERRMMGELAMIVENIPRDQLSIQWDTAVEFALLEGVMPTFIEDPHGGIVERLVRIGTAVPPPVELGYHLCYGDAGHKHFCEPADTTKLVAVANAVVRGIGRAINWIHLPVPRDRSDDAYFRPLADLSLDPETELYLGLIHHTDGEAGARQRIATAARYCDRFGVATECGFGRRPRDTLERLLQIHANVAGPLR